MCVYILMRLREVLQVEKVAAARTEEEKKIAEERRKAKEA